MTEEYYYLKWVYLTVQQVKIEPDGTMCDCVDVPISQRLCCAKANDSRRDKELVPLRSMFLYLSP